MTLLLKQVKCVYSEDPDLYSIGKLYYYQSEKDGNITITCDDDAATELAVPVTHFKETGTVYKVYEEYAYQSNYNNNNNYSDYDYTQTGHGHGRTPVLPKQLGPGNVPYKPSSAWSDEEWEYYYPNGL